MGKKKLRIEFIVMMTQEGSTRIVNFIESVAGVLMVGCGSHYDEYGLSSSLSIYSTLVAFVLGENNVAFQCHC